MLYFHWLVLWSTKSNFPGRPFPLRMSDAGIVEQLNRGTLQRVTGHFNQVMNWLVKLLSGSKEVTYPPPPNLASVYLNVSLGQGSNEIRNPFKASWSFFPIICGIRYKS